MFTNNLLLTLINVQKSNTGAAEGRSVWGGGQSDTHKFDNNVIHLVQFSIQSL